MSKVFLVTVQIDFLLQSSLIYIAYYSINSFCVISLIFTRNLDSFNSYRFYLRSASNKFFLEDRNRV